MTKYTIEVTHYEDGVFVFIRDLDLNIAENDRVAIEAALKEALRIVRKQTAQRFQYERSAVMKQPHKHAELIKAWADGAEIEFKNGHGEWNPVHNPPIWSEYCEYRIKPEPKPDVVMYTRVHEPQNGNTAAYITNACVNAEAVGQPNLRIYYCGETGKLKKAEVLE